MALMLAVGLCMMTNIFHQTKRAHTVRPYKIIPTVANDGRSESAPTINFNLVERRGRRSLQNAASTSSNKKCRCAKADYAKRTKQASAASES